MFSYLFYMLTLFLTLYALFRFLLEHTFQLKTLLLFASKTAGAYVLGIALSAPVLFPSAYVILNNPRLSGTRCAADLFTFASLLEYVTLISRCFSNDILGRADHYFGWLNYYEGAILYCGVLVFLLIPQLFRFLPRKSKYLYGSFITLLIIFLVLPLFSLAMNAFSTLLYRWTFVVVTTLLVFAYQALDCLYRNKAFSIKALVVSGLAIVGALLAALFLGSTRLQWTPTQTSHFLRSMIPVILFVAAYIVLFGLAGKERYRKQALSLMLPLVCLELAFFSFATINRRTLLAGNYEANKMGCYDYSNEALHHIRTHDATFYRVDKDYRSVFLADAVIQGYKGLNAYNSSNQPSYLEFLRQMELQNNIRNLHLGQIDGFGPRYELMTLVGVKYYLSRKEHSPFPGYRFEKAFGNVRLYRNQHALPLAFTYHSYVNESDFARLTPKVKDALLLQAFVRHQGMPAPSGTRRLTGPTASTYAEDVAKLQQESLQISDYGEDFITGTVILDTPGLLFFSIPYDPGWHLKVDAKPVILQRVNFGFLGAVLAKGTHDLNLTYTPPFLIPGLWVSLCSLLILASALCLRRRQPFSGKRALLSCCEAGISQQRKLVKQHQCGIIESTLKRTSEASEVSGLGSV